MADEQIAGTADPAGQAPPAGTASPSGTGATPPPATQPGAGTPPVNDDAERRFRGIQQDLQRERQARQQFQQQLERQKTELEQERRRVQALAGVNPKSPQDADTDLVRERFAAVFPGLAKLTDEQIEKLLGMSNNAEQFQQATQHHWQTHGRQMLDAVTESLTSKIGGKLSDRQAASIKAAYVREAEANPEFLARHEQGDRTLIEEFTKQWVEDWIEPARRIVTSDELNRQRRVPNSSGRRDVTGGAPKAIDYKNPKAVEDAMVESFRQHGGHFD